SVGRTVVDASIRIDELPEILPGYSFSGAIVAGEQEEILVLKQDGLRYEKGAPFVDRVLPSGKIKSVPVTVEPYVPGFVKIISGLGAGDRVKDQSAARK
ncbi:efflux transporter periplasmic adaptor subunit, partial [Treponema pallidum]